ncbi:uncharacterized protein A4U43_C03F15370 [Asparagus officinalis]|uniref:Terpene synthase metal-binding domain-containing protein n=1 Tax=Asparagus officinalis TaxID=4686 RepID=A0A5P1FAA1_ASPOF|nr:uncharacterized protein A4U43_C03F15370 [Asparagus officinalis]
MQLNCTLNMESDINFMAHEVKTQVFSSSSNLYAFLPISAYDTAWVAMVPDPQQCEQAMFPQCLDWILRNQKNGGYWGEHDGLGRITDTLACLLALKKWHVGSRHIEKGKPYISRLEFLHANMERMLMSNNVSNVVPRWFALIFPCMLDLAQNNGLEVLLPIGCKKIIKTIFDERQRILKKDKNNNGCQYLPIELYLEALPTSYIEANYNQILTKYRNEDGSLFQSPSATAFAFIATGDISCMAYLENMLKRCGDKGRFCWFLEDNEMLSYIEENYTDFLRVMYDVYKASHICLSHEPELEKAKAFSKKILQKGILSNKNDATDLTELQKEIEHEVSVPWLARMDHLEHKRYIENGGIYHFQIKKGSFCRFQEEVTSLQIQLARKSFTLRQSIYRSELEEIKRWSKDQCLSEIGFGRETTTTCYFGIATVSPLPLFDDVRKVIAKCAIMITIIDDFFDEKASLEELHKLTNAVMRWNGDSLSGTSSIIFNALDKLVDEIAHHNLYVKGVLQDIWYETLDSWLREAMWSKSKYVPSIQEYLEVGMVSIAVKTMILSASFLMSPNYLLYFTKYGHSAITTMLMISCRLLNDTRSYQREIENGKVNLVLLYTRENPMADVEHAITHIRSLLDKHQRIFLELVKSNDGNEMGKELKELHLSCLKTFHMFYHSENAFDSKTALLQKINMAIYEPLADISSMSSHELDINRTKFQDYGRFVKVEGPHHGVNEKWLVKSKGTRFQAKRVFKLTSDHKFSSHIRGMIGNRPKNEDSFPLHSILIRNNRRKQENSKK